jgi:hypothetical protein
MHHAMSGAINDKNDKNSLLGELNILKKGVECQEENQKIWVLS